MNINSAFLLSLKSKTHVFASAESIVGKILTWWRIEGTNRENTAPSALSAPGATTECGVIGANFPGESIPECACARPLLIYVECWKEADITPGDAVFTEVWRERAPLSHLLESILFPRKEAFLFTLKRLRKIVHSHKNIHKCTEFFRRKAHGKSKSLLLLLLLLLLHFLVIVFGKNDCCPFFFFLLKK